MILDVDKFRAICGVGESVGEVNNNIETAIESTEQIEIKERLGNVLFSDIEKNKANYLLLLNGGEYTYDNKIYSFKGLLYAIAWQSFANYTKLSNNNTTAYGTVFKNSEYSQAVTDDNLKKAVNIYQERATYYINEVINYLKLTNNLLYMQNCDLNNSRFVQFNVIGG